MKAPGYDSIGTKVIQKCPEIFAENLSKIFNKAILWGVYSDAMKIAKIFALFKSGIEANLNNYRPISLLSHFNKIYDKNYAKDLLHSWSKKNIVLSSVWVSKIVFYSNGFDWDYRQYQAPSWRKELCNWNIYWLQEGFWYCWPWNTVEKIGLLWYSGTCKYVRQVIPDK